MKYLIWLSAFCFYFSLLGCNGMVQKESVTLSADNEEIPFFLPATFTGEIPCQGCLRVDITLNLRSDSIYQLRKTYQAEHGPVTVESQLGRWRFAEDGRFIILGKERGALKSYAIKDENHLKFVGIESVEDALQIEYDLLREELIDPFTDSVKLRGMLKYDFGEAVMAECTSGQSFPVTGEQEFGRLVQTYLNTPHGHADPLLVSIRGRLVKGGASAKSGAEQIVVEQFKRFYPDRDCEGKQTRANLTGTIWRLIEVDGQQVTLEENMQRPYFTLDANIKELKGFSGCNEISGSYLVKGEVLLIKRLISTRMACPDGVDVESSFLKALDKTETFLIDDDLLQLLDQEGKTKAVLRADS